jgi:hypothetical protein
LGKRAYSRWREVWCSRRNHETGEETKAILQLHGFDLLDEEPTRFEEAIQKKEWADAMTEEYQSIIKNDVWEIVPRPKSKDVVSSKWLFKIKHAANGSIEKYKARFVARGFSQKKGIDYEETFAPVARYTSIRTVIAQFVV